MNSFNLYSLQEFLDKFSSNQVKKILKTLKCNINKDIETFLYNKAITFERKLRARTYLLLEKNTLEVAGYFSIAISVLYADEIEEKVLLEIGDLQTKKDIPCLLIGQIAKSDNYKNVKLGKILMEHAIEKLEMTNKIIGGRFILLDAINNQKIIEFYENFGFFVIEESNKDSIKMIRPFYD